MLTRLSQKPENSTLLIPAAFDLLETSRKKWQLCSHCSQTSIRKGRLFYLSKVVFHYSGPEVIFKPRPKPPYNLYTPTPSSDIFLKEYQKAGIAISRGSLAVSQASQSDLVVLQEY
jgi:hypothetical protein